MPIGGLHDMTHAEPDVLAAELREAGWKVFVLPRGISDRESFFRGVREVAPLDPPVLGDRKWDALSDSLWNGLDSLDEGRIAIIWPESTTLARVAPDDFIVAQDILAKIAVSLGSVTATVNEPKEVFVGLA